MNLCDTKIETERLLLVPSDQQHAEVIFYEFTSEVTELMYPRPSADLDETRRFIADSRKGLEPGTNLHVVILLKDTSEFLGCAGLHDIGSGRPELGVWLKMSAHSNGYGMEAVAGLKHWADENLRCAEYIYPVDVRNSASKRIAIRLGGQIVEEYDEVNQSGKTLHIVTYAVTGCAAGDCGC